MSRSQSWKNLGPEGEKAVDLRRASSQPLYTPQTTASESNFAASNASFKSSMEDMRRRIVHLNKELEQERQHCKNLKRDKALEIRQVRDEEQKKASAMQADLRSKLHKEKMNELTSLKEQLHKEKEKEIMQIIRQKDEILRSAQQAWAKEKEDLKSKVRNELRGEAREDTKREFEKERGRLEQEIADLDRQKRELEETLKLVQGADKRKIDDIRRIHHEHEAELEKFKRNSWQESRQQMAEIRQLLNIIEQLEKKLGLEAGHSMRLRLEKDSLSDMLKKSSTFDAWDRMMSSGKSDSGQATPTGAPDTKGGSQELRMLQRKNVELSSLVRKLDEKNQQLATRNAELLAELEKLEKDSRDKNRKLERKNADISQTNRRLESRNKMLLDEVNSLKKSLTGRKENSVKPRGKASKEQDDLGNLKAQMREQTRTIADLKQSLMEKDRRIELLRGRRKKSKQQPASLTSLSAELHSATDDDAMSVHSDFSEASEMSSSDDVDSKRIKKLAKELLALERAYALLQAHAASAVDAERDEMEKQQLQSDLLESQARIHELERMMNDSGQGTGSEDISQLQADNKDLYQKLISAEKARDEAQGELAKYTEDMRELQDQRDLLEFELEEMSQLSTAGSEDWDSRRSRSNDFEISPSPRMLDNDSAVLSLEEIKACLEEVETEKGRWRLTKKLKEDDTENVLSPVQQSALKQARAMLESMAEKINHMEITESALRDKVRDLDLGYNSESLKSEFDESRSLSVFTCDQETLTDLQWSELDEIESYRDQQLEATDHLKHAHLRVPTEDTCCMTDLIWEDLVSMENMYRKYLNGFPEQLGGNGGQFDLEKDHKECMTDLVWQDLVELEETYRNILQELPPADFTVGKGKGEVEKVDSETMTELDREEPLEELESNYQRYREETPVIKSRDDRETITEIVWEELVQKANNDIYLSLSNEFNEKQKELESRKSEVGIMTELALSELAEMESKYFESVESAREPESNFDSVKEEVMLSSVDLVETLPEIVLDTFPEDFTCTKDQCEMTELKWIDTDYLEDKCYSYERYIEELESKLALFAVAKDEKSSCTEMSLTELAWNDIINLQDKCSSYERHIKDLEKKIASLEVEKDEKGSSTDISLQDLVHARFNVEMKEVETMTDAQEILDNEGLPQIVLETYPGMTETKDECDMTEGVWEEVVDLKNTYKDYRENLEEMKNKLAQFEVEKDDKESITDIAMQDIADLESLYKEHLHEVDSDSNSLLSHAEKESRECMTELTFVELSELEDFYIENAARVMESAPVVEKWEQESMTDVTLGDMQYLEEVEELYRQKAGSDGEDVEKDEKCTGTDLTFRDVDHLQEVEDVYLRSNMKKEETTEAADKTTATDLTIPNLALLEETRELPQSSPLQGFDGPDKEDRSVATELTVEDLKYWEEVEAAHEQCLLDREEEIRTGGVESEEKQDVETMTEFTMMDLQYLEEVDAAHEECLQDREEELERGRNDVETLSVEIMTDLTVSDLKYLEDVEAAHEECIVDKQDELEAQSVEKQDAESMTDFTVSDLQYLEDVEAAHEECIADKQQELESSASNVERQNAEMMTEFTLSDLQYLKDVEAAHEECIADKQGELEARGFRVGKESVEVMTDLTVSDLQYLQDVEAAHEECIADKQEELEATELGVEKENVEVMTDLTVLDLQYLQDVEAAHEECIADKQEELLTREVEVEKESVEVMTDLTVSDLQYLEEVDAAHEECIADKQEHLETSATIVDKQNAETLTDLTVLDLQHLEEELQAGGNGVDVEIMTTLTVSDLQYLEDVEAAHEECIADKQEELEARGVDVEKESVEVMTDLTVSDLQYLEDVDATHEECIADKQEELEARGVEVEKESVEVMTDLTVSDLQYLEDVEAAHEECIADKQEELETSAGSVDKQNAEMMTDLTAADLQNLKDKLEQLEALCVEKQNAVVMTDLTVTDLEYLEDVGSAHEECLANKQEELDARNAEKQSVEIMTDMTVSDLTYLEDVEAAHEECLVDKQDELDTNTVEKRNAEIMTELSVSDLQYLEDVEAAHEECLQDKEEQSENKAGQEDKLSVGTMTDLNAHDLKSLEAAATEHERSKTPRWRRWSRSSSISDHSDNTHNKNTMTEMTGNILEYYEDIEVLYKETMVEFDEYRRAHSAEKEEKDVMTDMTIEDLSCLAEDASSHLEKETEDKEIMTELTHDDLEYLMELESLYKDNELAQESKGMAEKCDRETMTELTVSYIEYVEGEFERMKHEQSEESDSSWVVIEPDKKDKDVMTELTESDLQHLEEVELLYKDSMTGAVEAVSKENAEAMTDLTTADLEYFEEAENLLKKISGDGGDLSGMLAPKDDKEVITDLTSSDIDYLQVLGDVYGDGSRELPRDGDVEKDEKGTETELTIADIRDLEDQLESATEMRVTPSFKEFVHEDFQAETLADLQSELDYLPVLDEPEFILDEEEEEEAEDVQRQDVGVMTELTLPDLEYLEERETHPSDSIMQATPEQVETGVQCELEGLGSLLQELSREAEEKGEDVPAWFVSALKMTQPNGGFNPIHLVVRQTDEVDAIPTDEHPGIESSPVRVLEETQLANAPDDLIHLPEDFPQSPGALSYGETDAESLPTDEADATSKDIGVQCDLVDVLAMLAEYQRNANDEDMPWFVSAMNMVREDTGFHPVQVHLTNRSDSSPVQDDVFDQHSISLMVELSRPTPRDGAFTVHSPPDGQVTEDELSDFPEADTPLFTCQDGSDSVLNRTDESVDFPNDSEERDVLTDMPRDSSAVNRFDRFLKERKDSELLNLMALRREMDDGGIEGAEYIKSWKELEEENELLRKQLQTLESAKNTEELEKENAILKEKVESVKDLEEENQLLKEEIDILRQSTAVEDVEEENTLLKDKIKMLEELATSEEDIKKIEEENDELREKVKTLEEITISEQDIKKIEEENDELREKVKTLEEMATSEQDIKKISEEENDELREKVKTLEEMAGVSELDMKKTEQENEELKEKLKSLEESSNAEELEKENDYLKQQVAMVAAELQRVKELEEENEILREKIHALEASANVVIHENARLKKQIEVMEENERVKELEDENEMLKEKVQVLEESSMNVEDLVSENALLKEQFEIMEETSKVKELEDENEMLKEKVQILEESSNVEDLVNENALLKEQIEIMEETGRVKELEDENGMLKQKVNILQESLAEEQLEHEQLLEKIQYLEESTARVVEKLEEENSMLKENIQLLEDSTSNMKELENENALLRERIENLFSSSNIQGLKEENVTLKEKIRSLEESASKDSLSKDDFELLQQKIVQLKEAEKKIGVLNESNMALKERIDLLQKEKENMRDTSSEMDTTEQLGKVRLLLVQDFGLTTSEVERVLGSCDLESLVSSSGMATPRAELNNLGQYFEQADRGVHTEAGDVPPSMGEPIRRLPSISGGVNQEIQTNLDSVTALKLIGDGSIPAHIAKELEKLTKENKELYEELMELRRQVQGREIAQRLNEATQTEHAQFPQDLTSFSRDVISPVSSSVEETITPQVRSTVATEIRYLGDRRLELELSPRDPYIPVRGSDYEGKNDLMDGSGIVSDSGIKNTMPSHHDNARDSDELISEPELVSSRRNLDSYMDDIDQRIQDLRHLDHAGRPRTDTSDLVVFDEDDDEGDLPPLPESSPPPLPSEPPPDFPYSPAVLDQGLGVLLRSESSPPRDAATLRATSRQRFRSDSKPSSGPSLPSSRVESPITVEEPTLVMESEPSELGGIYPNEESTPSSLISPTGFGSTKPADSTAKVPPQVLPKPKKILLQKRQPGPLSQPVVSYVDSNVPPPTTSQWSRDEEDGVIPPRGIVLNRATSINRGEIDALNEKIGFLERQLKSKENLIRTMKTDANELETQSLLERKDREMKILDEDVAFLKQENQKKERELLTKIGEMNKKNYEIEKWKSEANNSERQRQRMEAAYMNLQNQLKNLQGAELKLTELQTKYSGMEKQNFELSEKVKKLERTEREFQKLEHNIQLLQAQVQEMDIVEQDRNTLMEKMKTVENQRDDLLRKGRVVESERNDFLRSNKLMEMQRDDLENRCAILQKTNTTLNSRLAELEQDLKVAQTKMHDSQHERNFLQVQLDKMEAEGNEMQTRLAITTQERNSLENQVAELQDLNRDHVKLEDGFHSLRIKLAESTRQKDDAEMQIPTLKAKISLLKRACKEKDELVDKLSEEIRELRHSIATSALDDMSKIRSYGYSPENFVKLSAQREQERKIAKREPKDLVEERLQSGLEKQSPSPSPTTFEPSPPGTKKAKRFVALFDYDPHKSPACEHPELELKLKEGDFLTVFGDMDINGYFEADVNGTRGLVPSLYVEEVEDDNDSELALEEHLSRSRRDPLKDVPTVSDPLKDVPSHKDNELQLYRDEKSNGRCTPSSGTSSAGSEARQCMVALHDYDPFHSGAFGRPPQDQLSLKKGDIMTAYGDIDVNGFYRVDMNGQTGFVPGHLVEEVSSSSFLQPTRSRAPEQILGMLDNIQARGQPRASSTRMFTPPGVITNGYPTPTHALENVAPPSHVRLPGHPSTPTSHVRLPGDLRTPTNHVRLPGDLSTPTSHVRLPGDVRTPSSHLRPAGGLNSSLPDVGLARFKPSPEVAMLGSLNNTAVVPVNSTQSTPLESQKPVQTSLRSSASKQIVPVVSSKSRSRKARPSAPSGFRIIRPVNHDAMLVGWTLPEMDEFGRSNGLTVKGYKIYSNSDVKLDVRSPYMAKALMEDLELSFPIKFSIKTVAENGASSETVSVTFNDTIKGSLLDSFGESFEDSGDEQRYRTFVALYEYDPFKSSPNPNPATELGFKEGDILRVLDTSRKDGFYVGKLKNKKGLIPSNFVEEVAVASPRRLAAAKKRQAALPSPTRPISAGTSSSNSGGTSSVLVAKNPAQLRKKMMVALYDYNPEVQSPQDNPDSELLFKKGQILTVVGEMRADGFYHADVNGQLGLVPGSFLDEYTNEETDSGLDSGRRVSFEKGRTQHLLRGLSRT